MGRIKTTMIKKTARGLFETVPGFSDNFDANKKLLKNTMPSKSVRNKVAGGIVQLAKKKRLKEHGRQAEREQGTDEQGSDAEEE